MPVELQQQQMGPGPAPRTPPEAQATLPLYGISLRAVTETARMRELDRRESYYRGKQDDHKRYDWDGNFRGYGGEADIRPGWYVPLKRRKPSARWNLMKTIVGRFTGLLFGRDRWPEITMEGDEDAEDYAKALVIASKLPARMIEARNLGGTQGTACLSFAFVRGKPRVQIHNAKNVTVLSWDDPQEFRPARVVEAYQYRRRELRDGKIRDVPYYYVRYWDRFREVLYPPIPAKLGNQPNWAIMDQFQGREVWHSWGFCPFYWIQNLPDSYDVDGEPDLEELDNLDEINRLLSSTSKGTIANVDPTLVIKEDPARNDGSVRKGSGQAIWSRGGAEYLEIKGDAVKASQELLKMMRQGVNDEAQVVITDPDKMAARALSGEALRLLYAPMLAKCDLLREQYGAAIQLIVRDMHNACRQLLERKEEPITDEYGISTEIRREVVLPPRIENLEEEDPETGEKTTRQRSVKRKPGKSEEIMLNWGPYFPHTWKDIQAGVMAAQTSVAGRPVASHKTAIKLISSMTGIKDVDAELEAIETDAEVAAERGARMFGGGPPMPGEPPKPGTPPQPGEPPKPGEGKGKGEGQED